MTNTIFSPELQKKVDLLKMRIKPAQLGPVHFSSPLLLAPMSAICNAPYRLLMEQLGAGGTVSELISCHGINHGNDRTLDMLKIDPDEKNIGIQLFGEDTEAMAKAAQVAQEYGPKFIDINMGCPVRKVVTKGGGSALLKDTSSLGKFFGGIKKALEIPLTIKIRTGWDQDSINAPEVIHIAREEGVVFVAVHGRTRTQQYTGHANWKLLEDLAQESPLPLIGNGDLHTPYLVKQRLAQTNCQALMLGRGPIRNPFIFLESFIQEGENIHFSPEDYWEIIQKLYYYTQKYTARERTLLVQMRKHIVWMAAGFPNCAQFRSRVFETPSIDDTLKITEDYFLSLKHASKSINQNEAFMTSGHG